MSLVVPGTSEFLWSVSNQDGVRPAAAGGTSTPPGASNTKGSWASVLTGAQVAYDVWRISVTFCSAAASAVARDILADIGIDPTGGTSYSVLIPDLLASCAAPFATFSGVSYRFPLHIPAGSRIGVRAQVNAGTAGTLRSVITVEGRPRNPETAWKGTQVEAIGVDTAASHGTTVTAGTTSEGAWTSLGTVTDRARWWEVGMGVNDSTMTAVGYNLDLSAGAAGGDIPILADALTCTTSAEQLFNFPSGVFRDVPAGSTIWGRMQCSGTPDADLSMAAYAVS